MFFIPLSIFNMIGHVWFPSYDYFTVPNQDIAINYLDEAIHQKWVENWLYSGIGYIVVGVLSSWSEVRQFDPLSKWFIGLVAIRGVVDMGFLLYPAGYVLLCLPSWAG